MNYYALYREYQLRQEAMQRAQNLLEKQDTVRPKKPSIKVVAKKQVKLLALKWR